MADQFAVVTGASSGIGYELARCCAAHGFDLLIAADEPQIAEAAREIHAEHPGVTVEPLEVDLATLEGNDRLYDATRARRVAVLLANAGRGLGRAFVEQDFAEVRRVIDTNVTGTVYLVQKIARDMCNVHYGRILITGSIAGFMPGTYQAVYNGTKAFLDSFAFALRHEVAEHGVSVTCLMPGATETEFFERADMMDTQVGQAKKDDAAEVAKQGFAAMMEARGQVITGWHNKLQAAIAHVAPSDLLAEMHRRKAQPHSAH